MNKILVLLSLFLGLQFVCVHAQSTTDQILVWDNGKITSYRTKSQYNGENVKSIKVDNDNWTIVYGDGYENKMYNSDIDSITFSISPWMFKVAPAKVTEITETSAKVEINAWLNMDKAPYKVWPLEGVCFSDNNEIPTKNDNYKSTYGFSADQNTLLELLEGLTPGTTYYIRPYVSLFGDHVYGEVSSFTTAGGESVDTNKYVTIDGHQFVDLGLPSGLKWASCNVGASRPEQYGDLFAWGETKAKTVFTSSNYKWANDSKYGTEKTVLDAEDDAATQNLGKNCRMPTRKELTELYEKCKWEVATINGVNGYKVIGKNGSYIFLPFAGSISGEANKQIGDVCNIWASSHHETDSRYAFYICGSSKSYFIGAQEPYVGLSVRAVAK